MKSFIITFSAFSLFILWALEANHAKADWISNHVDQNLCSAQLKNGVGSFNELPNNIRNGLILIFRNYVKKRNKTGTFNNYVNGDLNIPLRTEFVIRTQKYKVLDFLGSGAEGAVYVAQGKNGIVIIKEFFQENVNQDSKFYADLRIVDSSERFLVLELIVGPTTDILRSESEMTDFGLSFDRAIEIYDYFEDKIEGEGNNNAIVDIITGKVFLVDPI